MKKQEEENVEEFTERVRELLASSLNLEMTDYTAADVGEYRKKLKAQVIHPQQRCNDTYCVQYLLSIVNSVRKCRPHYNYYMILMGQVYSLKTKVTPIH